MYLLGKAKSYKRQVLVESACLKKLNFTYGRCFLEKHLNLLEAGACKEKLNFI